MTAVVHIGNVLDILPTLPAESVNCCVTSPPYWRLRDYGTDGQMGLEPTPELYVANMVRVFSEVRRVLRDDGTLWLNLGDSYASTPPGNGKGFTPETTGLHGGRNSARYQKTMDSGAGTKRNTVVAGLKPKDLVGIPWRVAFALQADGWYLRSDIIWAKPNPMPESVMDRPTKAHEYVFLLSRSPRYFYDVEAASEPSLPASLERYQSGFSGVWKRSQIGSPTDKRTTGTACGPEDFGPTRNRRTVWTIATQPYPDAHFATYPEKLVEPCILAGCPEGGTVLDPFTGSGTTGAVACRLGRNFVGVELDFSQGLDARLLTDEHAAILKRTRVKRSLHLAFDSVRQERAVRRSVRLLREAGINVRHDVMYFVLVGYDTTPEEDLYRCELLRDLGTNPFVMPFDRSKPYQRDLARWANSVSAFRSCSFADYRRELNLGRQTIDDTEEVRPMTDGAPATSAAE